MTSAARERTDPSAVAALLDEGLAKLGIDVAAPAEERLQRYLALLDKWNAVYNLTAIREPARMVTHHLLDSLAAVPTLDALVAGVPDVRVLDVGSGAGLPGIPLALVRPGWHVTLCEPVQKKHAFLRQAIAELGLANATASLGRVEALRSPSGFAIVISRAFADLATFAASSLAQLAPGGVLVAMKGVHPDEELRELPADVRVVREVRLAVPGVDGARHLIVMQPAGAGRTPEER
jgi:16S rRNA (guanine527-N7)-methyltransferase